MPGAGDMGSLMGAGLGSANLGLQHDSALGVMPASEFNKELPPPPLQLVFPVTAPGHWAAQPATEQSLMRQARSHSILHSGLAGAPSSNSSGTAHMLSGVSGIWAAHPPSSNDIALTATNITGPWIGSSLTVNAMDSSTPFQAAALTSSGAMSAAPLPGPGGDSANAVATVRAGDARKAGSGTGAGPAHAVAGGKADGAVTVAAASARPQASLQTNAGSWPPRAGASNKQLRQSNGNSAKDTVHDSNTRPSKAPQPPASTTAGDPGVADPLHQLALAAAAEAEAQHTRGGGNKQPGLGEVREAELRTMREAREASASAAGSPQHSPSPDRSPQLSVPAAPPLAPKPGSSRRRSAGSSQHSDPSNKGGRTAGRGAGRHEGDAKAGVTLTAATTAVGNSASAGTSKAQQHNTSNYSTKRVHQGSSPDLAARNKQRSGGSEGDPSAVPSKLCRGSDTPDVQAAIAAAGALPPEGLPGHHHHHQPLSMTLPSKAAAGILSALLCNPAASSGISPQLLSCGREVFSSLGGGVVGLGGAADDVNPVASLLGSAAAPAFMTAGVPGDSMLQMQGQLTLLYNWYITNKNHQLELARSHIQHLEQQAAMHQGASGAAARTDLAAVVRAVEKAVHIMQVSSSSVDAPSPSPPLAASANQLSPSAPLDVSSSGAAAALARSLRDLDTCMMGGAGTAALGAAPAMTTVTVATQPTALAPTPSTLGPAAHDAAGTVTADLLLSALGLTAPATLLPSASNAAAIASGLGLGQSLHGSVTAALASQRSLMSGGDSQTAAVQLQGGVAGILSPSSIQLGPVVSTGLLPASLAAKPQQPAPLLIPAASALLPAASGLPGHLLSLGVSPEGLLPAAAFPLEVATN